MDINKMVGMLIVVAILGFGALFCFSNVEQNEVHVVQNLMTGNVYAKTKPGWYWSGACSVKQFPRSETFFFTSDHEGGRGDWSIETQFNDGAKGWISGTCRVVLPSDETELLELVKNNFTTWDSIEERLVLPVVRKSIVLTGNAMSSKESYSERRSDFISMAWDQVEKGPYVLKMKEEKVHDPVSGAMVTKITKEFAKDEKGAIVREPNPLVGTGVHLSNFEIKGFKYEDHVEKQIAEQQKNMMDVQTAKAQAQKAEQEALTSEAQGKANVMKAKYEQEVQKALEVTKAEKEVAVAEQNKLQALVKAQQEVAVAEQSKLQALVKAQQEKEVADVALQTAEINKKAAIATAEGQSESRKMILAADGALAQMIELNKANNQVWADAYAKRNVPNIMIGDKEGGASGSPTEAMNIMQMLQIKMAKDLMVDTTTKK